MNIIVGTKFDNKFNWYFAPQELWFFDLTKLDYIEDEEGINLYRDGIKILNEKNFGDFISNIETLKVDIQILKEKASKNCNKESLFPWLVIDVEKKTLYDNSPEPVGFDFYLPKGWICSNKVLEKVLKKEEIYW